MNPHAIPASFEIAGRRVGPGEPCLIIAEAGVNHNADLGLALQLVEAARAAGADVVKFQTWKTERLVTAAARTAAYQDRNLGGQPSQFDLLKKLELPQPHFATLKAHCRDTGIQFLSTPDEEESADFLDSLGVAAFKIGSGEVTNLPFLRHIARKGRPMILSTGMSGLAEVEAAVLAMEGEGNRQLVLLHCVSDYPAAAADCNLRAMATLRSAFGCPVGFSDHTMGLEISLAAVALGACVIEKHLTLDTAMEGPDHRASLNPADFRALVDGVRRVESSLGDGLKRPTAAERETRKVVQKSIVAARALAAGHVLTEGDVCLMRSGGGLESSLLSAVIGRQLRQALPAQAVITFDVLQ